MRRTVNRLAECCFLKLHLERKKEILASLKSSIYVFVVVACLFYFRIFWGKSIEKEKKTGKYFLYFVGNWEHKREKWCRFAGVHIMVAGSIDWASVFSSV